MTLGQAALWYADHGIPVFPCRPRGKKPISEHGFKDATTSREQVETWWRATPAANIGVPTGGASGWLLFDVDPRHGGDVTLDALLAKHGRWPETAEAITGGDGRHVFFKHVDGLSCGELAPGCDLKTTGGYAIVAPSLHPSGKAYKWDGLNGAASVLKLCDPPDWFLRLARERRKQPANANGNGVAAGITPGNRHKALVAFAGKLRRAGCDEGELLPALLNFNVMQCSPPKPEAEVRKIAAEIAKRYEPASGPAAPRVIEPDDCAALLAEELPPMDWIIDDLLPRGLYLLADREKGGKTFLAMQMALAVAMGRPVFENSERFRAAPARRVHYFDLEMDKKTFQERLHFLDGDGLKPGQLSRVTTLGRITENGIVELRDLLDRYPAELVVIDTLAAATRGGGAKRQDVFNSEYEELAILRDLAHERDITILLLHHTNKGLSTGNVFDAISGTRARGAATDGNFVIGRANGVVSLHVVGRRLSGDDIAIRFQREPVPKWTYLGDASAVQRSAERDAVLRLLAEAGPALPKDIAAALVKRQGAVRYLLMAMRRDGEVERLDDGSYIAILTPREAGSCFT